MPAGWIDGADETKGQLLGCKLGAPVLVGAAKVDGISEGMEDGWADALGDSNGIDEGTPVLVGLVLGWIDG